MSSSYKPSSSSKHRSGSASDSSRGYNGRFSRLLLLPLAILVGFVPLIVRVREYRTYLEEESFFDSKDIYYDFFLYHKAQWIIVIASVMACIVVFRLVTEGKSIKFSRTFLPLAGYAFFILISGIASDHSFFCYNGIYEQFQSMWVQLGYCMIAYYAFLFINDINDVRFILRALSIGTAFMLLLGLTQAFGVDFFRTTLGQRFILDDRFFAARDQLDFSFEKGRVYLSLYNPNYVGSYASLLTPVFAMMALATDRLPRRIFCIVTAIGVLLCLLGSSSRAGFIGIVFGTVIIAIICNKELIRNWYPTLIVVILLIGTVFTMNNYSNGALTSKVRAAFTSGSIAPDVTSIRTLSREVAMTYRGNDLHVRFEISDETGDFSFRICDSASTPIAFTCDDGYTLVLTDPRFSGISVSPVLLDDDMWGFGITVGDKPWYFYNDGTENYYVSNYFKLLKLPEVRTVDLLEKHGRFASGRGFIWARTLPLLTDHVILGSGADTFIFEFPNDDFVGLHNSGYDNIVITKPHNMYLQIGVETGVLSVLCVLSFFLMYFIPSIKLYMKKENRRTPAALLGLGILAGTSSYMFVQFINDSCVTVAPLYWALTGIGIALNRIVVQSSDPAVRPSLKH